MQTGRASVALLTLTLTLTFILLVGCGGGSPSMAPASAAVNPSNTSALWPALCSQNLTQPQFVACSWSKSTNFGVDASHPGYFQGVHFQGLLTEEYAMEIGIANTPTGSDTAFQIPTQLMGGHLASSAVSINLANPNGQSTLDIDLEDPGGTRLFNVNIVVNGETCLTTVTYPDLHKETKPLCTLSTGQMIYNTPALAPMTLTFTDKTNVKSVLTPSFDVTSVYADPPTTDIGAVLPAFIAGVPTGAPDCTLTSGKNHCHQVASRDWGTCDATSDQDSQGYSGKLVITIGGSQTSSNGNCLISLGQSMNLATIAGEIFYQSGGGFASMEVRQYACQTPGDSRCVHQTVTSAKIGFQPPAGSCELLDLQKGCGVAIEGLGKPPVVFSKALPTASFGFQFNSDMPSAHPDPQHPDIITIEFHGTVK